MMHLYLVRHAAAVLPQANGGLSDEARPLTAEGRAQAASLGRAFQQRAVPVDRVLTSPLVRARETAELLAAGLGNPDILVELCPELAPGGSAKRLAKMLRKLHAQHVVLVGHMPELRQQTAWLIGGKKASIDFAKGGAACVVCDAPPRQGAGTLLWMVTPDWIADRDTGSGAEPSTIQSAEASSARLAGS